MERILYLHDQFCAVAEDGRLVEYIPITAEDRTGMILRGKVNRMMPGLEAAFVDIGGKRDGFLPLKENSQTFTGGAIRSGDTILVQVRKEENGGKGAYLTRDICIPGSCLIFMPMNRHIGVSARITDEKERAGLQEWGKQVSGGEFGLVIREAALKTDLMELLFELEALKELWKDIQEGNPLEGSAGEELIRDYKLRGIDRILRDAELSADLERQRKEAENRKIRLPHGGNIVIDKCEAMTVIDVNSASEAGQGTREATALRTNLEACREVMIQARLRNLAGILIIDFIDMDKAEDQSRVQAELEACFREDRIKTVIHGFTSLGLMEMTRKRTRSY